MRTLNPIGLCSLLAVTIAFIICTSFSSTTSDKHFVDGWYIKNNGDRVDCSIKLFMYDTKKISYKSSDNKKKQSIESKELKEIGLMMGDSTVILHKYESATYSGLGKFKAKQGQKWMQEIYKTDRVTGYNMIIFEGGGRVGTNASGGATLASGKFLTVQYGLRMADNDYVLYFPIELWWDRSDTPKAFDVIYRKIIAKYLKDYCPSFAKSFKKSKYKIAEFEASLDAISTECQ